MSTNQSMVGFIKEAIDDLNQIKITFFQNRYNAHEVFYDVSCVGTFLKHHGVQKGDSVIICLPNMPQGVVALYAINSVGAIANIVHPKIGTKGLMNIVEKTKTKWIFLFDRFVKKHRKNLLSAGVKIISCRLTDCMMGFNKIMRLIEPNMAMKSNVVTYNKTLVKPKVYDVEIKGEDVAIYLHSSGTTGEPKTVMLSNYAMNELAYNLFEYVDKDKDGIGLNKEDGMLMALPLFHGFGLAVCVHFMMYFGRIEMIPMFKAKSAVNMIRKSNVTLLTCVPNMLRKMTEVKSFDGKHLQKVRAIFVGGDKLDDTLRDKMQELFDKNGSKGICVEGFGLSETASVTHINLPGKKGGTVGKPMPNVKAKIVDENGNTLKAGEEGNLYISSTSIMYGYLNIKDSGIEIDENGVKWLKTGDIAYIDEEGFMFYRGRQKRMLKIGGVNIYPQEVEAVAKEIKGIENTCAVRIKLPNGKPALKLYVTLSKGVTLDNALQQKICNEISSHILPYATPKIIEKLDEFKLTGVGKTDYRYYEELEKEKV